MIGKAGTVFGIVSRDNVEQGRSVIKSGGGRSDLFGGGNIGYDAKAGNASIGGFEKDCAG